MLTLTGSHIWLWAVDEDNTRRFDDHASLLDWLDHQPGLVVPCWTCGAAPIGTFPDGSWRYDCHLTSGIPHGPTTSADPLWRSVR